MLHRFSALDNLYLLKRSLDNNYKVSHYWDPEQSVVICREISLQRYHRKNWASQNAHSNQWVICVMQDRTGLQSERGSLYLLSETWSCWMGYVRINYLIRTPSTSFFISKCFVFVIKENCVFSIFFQLYFSILLTLDVSHKIMENVVEQQGTAVLIPSKQYVQPKCLG